jgi:hypothetical protein
MTAVVASIGNRSPSIAASLSLIVMDMYGEESEFTLIHGKS